MDRARSLGSAGHVLFGLLSLCGCEPLFVSNPANCIQNQSACTKDERCNAETQRCETLDCVEAPGLCLPSEFCSTERRCTPKTCVMEASLCARTQICNPVTQACETRQFVLGQPDENTNQNAAYGMSQPFSASLVPPAVAGGTTRLIVADSGNSRVLIWNDVPTANRPADAVLGMPDIHTLSFSGSYNGTNERSLSSPWSVASDGVRLIVGDQEQQRALIWSQIPSAPSMADAIAANRVWGQFDFESSRPDAGLGDTNDLGLDHPRVFFDRSNRSAQRFFISDRVNHRVLIFPGIPDSPRQAPAAMVGQADYFSYVPETTATGLDSPLSLWSDGTQLFVADSLNNRVLGYNLPLPALGGSASLVFGQMGFTAGTPNRGGAPSQLSLYYPSSVCVVGTATRFLFVADQDNHRVLRYTLPSAAADLVLGQVNFALTGIHRGATPTAGSMNEPVEVTSDGTRLVVVDALSNRVMIWNTLPTVNGQAADVILGQPDGASTLPNNPPTRSLTQMRMPSGVATDGTILAVADSENHRVLIWKSIPLMGSTPPDVVLGQSDGSGNRPNTGLGMPTASTLNDPQSVSIDGSRLIVADTRNHRVLIWNQIPAQSFAPADVVIGQPSFTTSVPQMITVGLREPSHAVLSGGTLFVADTGANRVLLYRDPFRANATADVVLGQPGLGAAGPNTGGQSAKTLAQPRYVHVHEGKLLVADSGNHRVLVWNTIPGMTQPSADVLIGQGDFATSYTRTDRPGLFGPFGIVVHGGRLYVSSALQNRILYWNQIPTKNGERADGVLGQVEFLSSLPNNFELSRIERLSMPQGIASAGDQLFIADSLNHRVVVRGLPR
jgi:hypothetical protein